MDNQFHPDPGYGEHPTIYSWMSNEQLFMCYREDHWIHLSEFQRQQLFQETVNRSAEVNGEVGSCEVLLSDGLPSTVAGQQLDDKILMNRALFADNHPVQIMTVNGKTYRYEPENMNVEALVTLIHEDIHAWQKQCINGTIENEDEFLQMQLKANNFSVVHIPGSELKGQTYMTGESETNIGYYLYYLQATERDAHRFSEQRVIELIDNLNEKYGEDLTFISYKSSLENSGYEAELMKAKILFNDENIEQDINYAIMNRYYGINLPVKETVQKAVDREMQLSYSSAIKMDAEQLLPMETVVHLSKPLSEAVIKEMAEYTEEILIPPESAMCETANSSEEIDNNMEESEMSL